MNLLNLLDWIYKKRCYFCKSSKESVEMCSSCFDKMMFLPAGANRVFEGVNIFCAGPYSKELQKLIRGLKYHKKTGLAYYQAKFMYEYWQKLGLTGSFQVVPVPLHKNRTKRRKYNHMELVADEFAILSGFDKNFELIKRVKDTKPQYKLTKKERLINLHGAFEVDKKKLKSGKILVLDDICTTGSTFEEIIKEFRRNDIDNIVCFATTTPL